MGLYHTLVAIALCNTPNPSAIGSQSWCSHTTQGGVRLGHLGGGGVLVVCAREGVDPTMGPNPLRVCQECPPLLGL